MEFIGEISAFSLRQQEFLSEVLEKRGYKNNKVVIEAVGNAGDNYVANVKRITVEDDTGNFKLIAKIAPSHEMMRAMAGIPVLFENESLIYNEIFPMFAELQKKEGLDIFRFPECYGILSEKPNELILLEDLQVLNFVMLDRFQPLSDECIKLTLKNLAVYHSLSMVLKTKMPEFFETVSKKFQDVFANMFKPMFTHVAQGIVTMASMVLDNDRYKNVICNKLNQLPEIAAKVLEDQTLTKQSVIIQGDVWTNNLLFKMQDELPLECIMLDYQQSRHSNPASDILNLIFNCTDHKSRLEHYKAWIDYYYTELEDALSKFEVKADFIFAREQLDDDLKKYSKLVFGTAILMLGMMTTKPEDAMKMKEMMEKNPDPLDALRNAMSDRDKESLYLFKKKIEELVDSCQELGYIE